MLMRYALSLIFIVIGWIGPLGSQTTIGIPTVVNYNKKDYNGASQNWMFSQLQNGVILTANNDGLLTYDGVYWKKYFVSNKTIVRSVAVDPSNKIYAGAQDELGYFLPDSVGDLKFYSLKNKLPENYRSFTDVWDIQFWGNHVFFRTEKSIFVYDYDTITVHEANVQWTNMSLLNGKILAHQRGGKIYEYKNGRFEQFLEIPAPYQNEFLSGIEYDSQHQNYIVGLAKAIFRYDDQGRLKHLYPPLQKAFELAKINRFKKLSSGDWIVASQYQGAYIISKNLDWVQHFTVNEGMQNNHVNYIFEDNQKNIWFALENGIDVILNSNAIKRVLPEGKYDAAGYAMAAYENHLYLGTTNSIYKIPIQTPGDFSYQNLKVLDIPQVQGQIRNIQKGNFSLIFSKHEGIQFYNPKLNKVQDSEENTGYWTFQPIVWNGKLAWIAGHYFGLNVWTETPTGFKKEFSIPDFWESSRFVEVDQQNRVWISHPYRGVYLLESINDTTSPILFGEEDGLPSKMNNHVFKLDGRVIFCTSEGIYKYDETTRRFIPNDFFKKYIGKMPIRYVKQDEEGNWWFISDKKIGVIDFSESEPQYWEIAELEDQMVRGFDKIEPIDPNNLLIGTNEGFVHINFKEYKKRKINYQPILSTVILNEGQQIYNGFGSIPNGLSVDYIDNQLKFQFSTTAYGNIDNVKFAYRLVGFQDEWSEWSSKFEKEYMNLPSGKFVFEVKLKTNNGLESDVEQFEFEIFPPWYLSIWAYLVYSILILGVIFYFYYAQHQRYLQAMLHHQEEQERLKYLHDLEMQNSERELVQLRNEKLQRELAEKNQELASNSLNLVHKEEVLAHLKENLQKVNTQNDIEFATNEIKRLLKKLGEEEKKRETWEQFAVHFDLVHANFIKELIQQYPNLSPNEVKLCTYLRMNLSSKEIAQLMNISVRGVEISRYRLRKKLNLNKEENLFHFLFRITK